jgi:hypothetical protein
MLAMGGELWGKGGVPDMELSGLVRGSCDL